MKLNKFISLAVALLSVLAVSCSQNGTATGDASVGFSGPEFETGLGSQYIKIPIVTEGESTVYPIKVQVEVVEYTGDYAAVENVDYMITSKEILVASAESTPSIEVKILNPQDADALFFKLKIVSQENAQSISQGEVLVKCEKSDLDRICGTYTVSGSYADGSAANEKWEVTNDGSKLQITGMFGEPGYIEGELEDGKVVFPLGPGTNNMIGAYNFTGIGNAYVGPALGALVGDDIAAEEGPHDMVLTIGDNFDTLTFNLAQDQVIVLGVYTYDAAQTYLGWFNCLMLESNTISKQ